MDDWKMRSPTGAGSSGPAAVEVGPRGEAAGRPRIYLSSRYSDALREVVIAGLAPAYEVCQTDSGTPRPNLPREQIEKDIRAVDAVVQIISAEHGIGDTVATFDGSYLQIEASLALRHGKPGIVVFVGEVSAFDEHSKRFEELWRQEATPVRVPDGTALIASLLRGLDEHFREHPVRRRETAGAGTTTAHEEARKAAIRELVDHLAGLLHGSLALVDALAAALQLGRLDARALAAKLVAMQVPEVVWKIDRLDGELLADRRREGDRSVLRKLLWALLPVCAPWDEVYAACSCLEGEGNTIEVPIASRTFAECAMALADKRPVRFVPLVGKPGQPTGVYLITWDMLIEQGFDKSFRRRFAEMIHQLDEQLMLSVETKAIDSLLKIREMDQDTFGHERDLVDAWLETCVQDGFSYYFVCSDAEDGPAAWPHVKAAMGALKSLRIVRLTGQSMGQEANVLQRLTNILRRPEPIEGATNGPTDTQRA